MCEQTEVQYLPDEIVWVKLHQPSLWWPGQVQDYDTLPEEVTEGLRRKPIAIVKFFQEDSYEYVNNLNYIYHYNCSKKHDFIKKGLALARSKRPERPAHMDLFPQDVATAESLTHGDPDIIRDDAFAPEEKKSYDGLFGSEKKKNLKKTKGSLVDSILRDRPSWRVKPLLTTPTSSSPRTPSSPKSTKVITHPRFINKALKGETDHRVFIREQPVVEDETASPSSEYRCHNCDFVTARLNVIVLHYRSHSKTVTPIPNRTKLTKPKSVKASVTKPKPETPTKASPAEPLKKRNIMKEESAPPPPEKTEKTSPKKSLKVHTPKTPSPKTQTPKIQAPKRKAKMELKPEDDGKKAKKEEIQELLKDWSDEEMEEESKTAGKTSDDEERPPKEEPKTKMDVDEPKVVAAKTEDVNAGKEKSKSDKKTKESTQPVKSKAVFDFDDTDEGLDPKLAHNTRVFGRKLPRVIDNIKEKRTSILEVTEDSKKEKKRKSSKTETREETGVSEVPDKVSKKESAEREKELASMNAEIDSLLEKTSVPDLPDVPKLNTFSMDVTDEELSEKTKDKSILREHNNISVKESAEETAQSEEPSKNSLPEVGSAVDQISTPPQASSGKNTAGKTPSKAEPVKSAVITSVILSSPLTTTGGDHSYVSDKRPRASHVPPLVRSSPKSPPGKSSTYIVSRTPPVKTQNRLSDDPEFMRVINVASTVTKSTKQLPSLVKKDSKLVIIRSPQQADQKATASHASASSSTAKVITQPQTGKKLVILTKKPSGGMVLTPPKHPNILSSSSKAKASASSVIVSASQSPKTVTTKTVVQNVLPPKKNIMLTSGGSRDAKTFFVPVSSGSAKSPTVYTTRSPGTKSIILPPTMKLVSSKDSPGKITFQMDSQKTKVTFPSLKRADPQVRSPNQELFSPLKMSPVMTSSKLSSAVTTRTVTSGPSPKSRTPQTLTMYSGSKSFTALSSPKSSPSSSAKAYSVVTPPKTLTSPTIAKTAPKQTNKFFHRDSTSTPTRTTVQTIGKQTLPIKKTVVMSKPASIAQASGKANILQTPQRSIIKRAAPSKTTPVSGGKETSKESKPEMVMSAHVQGSVVTQSLESGSIVAAPAEGSVDGASFMYILDNGTLISYDQVNQGDNQPRTVFIDPASLTSSSGDLSNLIFTFDDSAGSQGTLLSIAQPEVTRAADFPRRAGSSTQDILAEALANTQVLQAEATASELILESTSLPTNTVPSSSALYPNNVLTLSNDVLETSLTLNQPIMTPLEVPSAVSSLQPPPASSGSLELPITIAQPDITISTSSYASLPIPSATIQGTVFPDASHATYSTVVPVLSGGDKQTFFVEATEEEGAAFDVTGGAAVFARGDQIAGVEGAAVSEAADA